MAILLLEIVEHAVNLCSSQVNLFRRDSPDVALQREHRMLLFLERNCQVTRNLNNAYKATHVHLPRSADSRIDG